MNLSCYLVIVKKKGKEARAARVTQGKPALAADESMIHLHIELPPDVFDAPMITVPIERRQVAVAVEVDEA